MDLDPRRGGASPPRREGREEGSPRRRRGLVRALGIVLCLSPGLAISLTGCGSTGGGDRPGEQPASNPDCIGCHVDDYEGAHRHPGVRSKRCEVCHGQEHWHPITKSHPSFTLTGAHDKADCFACHSTKPPVYEGTSRECIACHKAEFDAENAKHPSHARSSVVCDKCHSTNEWSEWPGHAKGDRTPSPTPTTTAAPTAPATATATASVTKTWTPPKPKPTVKPKPTTAPTPTPTPTPAPTPTPIPTHDPPIITGPSRR